MSFRLHISQIVINGQKQIATNVSLFTNNFKPSVCFTLDILGGETTESQQRSQVRLTAPEEVHAECLMTVAETVQILKVNMLNRKHLYWRIIGLYKKYSRISTYIIWIFINEISDAVDISFREQIIAS